MFEIMPEVEFFAKEGEIENLPTLAIITCPVCERKTVKRHYAVDRIECNHVGEIRQGTMTHWFPVE